LEAAFPGTVTQFKQDCAPLLGQGHSWAMSLTAGKAGLVLCLGTAMLAFAPRTDAAISSTEAAATNVMDLSFDELLAVNVDKVYGASKFEQDTTRAPSSVSIVTRDEFQKQGYRTLADALRSVNGLFMTDDRNYSYLGIRGFNRPGDYNSRVLLLVDGHRMNDAVYDQGFYGTEAFLDTDDIERVEVIRGPSSSIYGNNAFFGVVNVVTRPGRTINGLEATAQAGDDETFKGGLRYGKQWANGLEVFLSGSIYDSEGEDRIFFPEFNSPTNNNGVAVNSDHDRAYNFFGSVGFDAFTLTGGWAWREKVIPTASYATAFNDGGEQTTDQRAYVDLKYDQSFDHDLRFIGHVAYDSSSYYGYYPYLDTNIPPARNLNTDEAFGQSLGADWQLNWLIAGRHTLIVGGDYRENLEIAQRNFDDNPPQVNLDDDRTGRNVGVFAQAEVALMTNLLVNLGGRYDYYSTFGGTVNPRLALIWDPWKATTFKVLYGGAFRAPNAYELYYGSYYPTPGSFKANPDLNPEEITTYELVWEQRLPANMRFSAAGYFYKISDLVSQVVDPADDLLVFQNIENVRAQGLELSLEKRGPAGLLARVSYAIQSTEDETTDGELSNSPNQMAKLNLIAPLWKDKLFAGVDLQYYSGSFTVQGNKSDSVFVLNGTLFSQRIVKNLEVSASVYNLLNERNGFSGSAEHVQDTIPLAGRSFRVKVTYRF
jgi:outer membrane receptor for ferrienterochelin and colicins